MNFSTNSPRNTVRSRVENNTTFKKLIVKYQALSKREQILLWLLSAFLVVYLFYAMIWQPIKLAEQTAQKRLEESYKTYYLLAENAELIASTKGKDNDALQDRTAEELQSLVISMMRQQKIAAQRLNIEGDSRLQVWVENSPYAPIAKLLAALADKKVGIYNLQLISRDVGVVDMRLTLD